MDYRENTILGKPISRIGFGGAAISGEGGGYGFGIMDEASAEKLIKEAWERGINLFDTAPIYGFGLSEERLGRHLAKDAIVVTKGGVDWHPSRRVNMSNDPKIIERMLLESLKRLRREQIDIYMIHWPDKNVDIRRPMEVLSKYQQKGTIAHLGLCNTTKEDLQKAQQVASISSLQSEVNLFNHSGLTQLGESWKNYFTMGWGTLDKGILSGRVTQERKFDSSDARSWAPWWNKTEVARKIEKVEKLKTILNDYQLGLTEFCLHFNLNYIGVASCLIGSKNDQDFQELSGHLHRSLSMDTIEEVLNRWNN